MIERFPPENLTPDDRQVRAKWACRLGFAYGAALLPLVGFVIASNMIGGSKSTPRATIAPAPQVTAERMPTTTAHRPN